MTRYKLLGEIWDGKPTKKYKIIENVNLDVIRSYNKGYCLFDYIEYERKIKLSSLIDVQNNDDLNEIILKIGQCKKLYIELDCITEMSNNIVRTFVKKRIMQVNYVLSSLLGQRCKIYYVKMNRGE